MINKKSIDRNTLRQLINDSFNESELQDICFQLDIDYENLKGISKGDKSRELVAYCERRNKLAQLIEACNKARPNNNWQGVIKMNYPDPSYAPSNKPRWPVIIVFVSLIIVIGYLFLAIRNNPVVRITSLNDGDQISSPIDSVHGRFDNVSGTQDIWLILIDGSTCFPMDGPVTKTGIGNWSHGPLHFFENKQYQFAAVVTNSTMSTQFRNAVGLRSGIACPQENDSARFFGVITLDIQFSSPLPTLTPTVSPPFTVAGGSELLQINGYTESAICVTTGSIITITADGVMKIGTNVGDGGYVDPRGTERGFLGMALGDSFDLVASYPHGSLMYRIAGEDEWRSYAIATHRTFEAPIDGCLQFEINDNDQSNNDEHDFFDVEIRVVPSE